MRPVLRPLQIAAMEFLHRNPERFGRAADLIDGGQAVIDIASSILQTLGHHRPAQLLELEHEIKPFTVLLAVAFRGAALEQENVTQKVEDGGGHGLIAALGAGNRRVNVGAVTFDDIAAFVDVGAIHREAGDGFADRRSQRLHCKSRACRSALEISSSRWVSTATSLARAVFMTRLLAS